MKVFRRFEKSVPIFKACIIEQGRTLSHQSFGSMKPPAHPEDGDVLTLLSAQEILIEFCRRESFKIYIIAHLLYR